MVYDRWQKFTDLEVNRSTLEKLGQYCCEFLIHAVDLLLESPVFALTMDIGHDHAIKNVDKPVIAKREEYLAHMHMHDALGSNVHLALGDGEMDIPAYIALAKKRCCRIVLETKTVEALKKSVSWLKEKNLM